MTDATPATCKWFLRCDRPAAGLVAHPILGDVPTCQPCADRLVLDLRPRTVTAKAPTAHLHVDGISRGGRSFDLALIYDQTDRELGSWPCQARSRRRRRPACPT